MRWLALLLLAGCAHPAPSPFPQLEQVRSVEAPSGNVVVSVEPPDATVAVDGVTQGLGSDFDGVHGALSLTPGEHRLGFSKAGYRSFSTTVEASESGRQTLQVVLDKE